MKKINESTIVTFMARIAPWFAPLPTAYLVAASVVRNLHWPGPIGWITGAIVESLGLSTSSTALELYQYNRSKRKDDPQAPFVLASVLVGVYFLSAILLTVLLDTMPEAIKYAPVIFPVLSLTGVMNLALRSDHAARQARIAEAKEERKALRKVLHEKESNTQVAKVHLTTEESILAFYRKSPLGKQSDCAAHANVSRQRVGQVLDALESKKIIHRNGNGVEML